MVSAVVCLAPSGCGPPRAGGRPLLTEEGPVVELEGCAASVPKARNDDCDDGQCGSNSSYLTGFELGELRLDGCRNEIGLRLLVDSLQGGGCPPGRLTLDVGDGALFGTTLAASCRGDDLEGATFWVEQAFTRPHGPVHVRYELAIRHVGTAATFDDDRVTLPSYRLERTGAYRVVGDVPTDRGFSPMLVAARTDLCIPADAWMYTWPDVDARASPGLHLRKATVDPSFVDQHGVLVAGERYDGERGDGTETLFTATDAPRSFYVACAGSALAKMRLWGMDPAAGGVAGRDARLATLDMLTARYCDRSYTEPGVLLGMDRRRTSFVPARGAGTAAWLEARWGARGATCLSHLRLWRDDLALGPFRDELTAIAADRGRDGVGGARPRGSRVELDVAARLRAIATGSDRAAGSAELAALEAAVADAIRTRCQIPTCGDDDLLRADEYWVTRALDHVAHPAR